MHNRVYFIDSDFDTKSGVSTATIYSTKHGYFSGATVMYDEDESYASNYFGCNIAHIRAHIKYMKAERKELRAKLDIMKQYYGTVSGMREFNPKSVEAKKARRIIAELTTKIDKMTKSIEATEKGIHDRIIERDKYIDKLRKEKNNEEEVASK